MKFLVLVLVAAMSCQSCKPRRDAAMELSQDPDRWMHPASTLPTSIGPDYLGPIMEIKGLAPIKRWRICRPGELVLDDRCLHFFPEITQKVTDPVGWVNLWVMAQLSLIAYMPLDDFEILGRPTWGFNQVLARKVDYFEAYIFEHPRYLAVSFRGTEKIWAEWLNNFDAFPDPMDKLNDFLGKMARGFRGHSAPEMGAFLRVKYHPGFLKAFEKLRTVVRKELEQICADRPGRCQVFYAGHSLGGAIATVAASELLLGEPSEKLVLGGIFTFGQPRTLSAAYRKAVAAALERERVVQIRTVKGTDIVTNVPPPSFMYQHLGDTKHQVRFLDDCRIDHRPPGYLLDHSNSLKDLLIAAARDPRSAIVNSAQLFGRTVVGQVFNLRGVEHHRMIGYEKCIEAEINRSAAG